MSDSQIAIAWIYLVCGLLAYPIYLWATYKGYLSPRTGEFLTVGDLFNGLKVILLGVFSFSALMIGLTVELYENWGVKRQVVRFMNIIVIKEKGKK